MEVKKVILGECDYFGKRQQPLEKWLEMCGNLSC